MFCWIWKRGLTILEVENYKEVALDGERLKKMCNAVIGLYGFKLKIKRTIF